jgi:DNA repair exonuclease SbcCD ATPase subunit
MAHHPSTPAPGPGFRRRFPLELSPEEYARLEEAGRTAGSKRAALLAGLEVLAERERGGSRATKEQTLLAEHAERAEERITELESALSEAHQKLKATSARAKGATRTTDEALAAAHRVRALEDNLAAESAAHARASTALRELRETHVDELRCPRCGHFAGPSEWASRTTKDGTVVYHEPCGYHEGGFIDETSVLGRRLR